MRKVRFLPKTIVHLAPSMLRGSIGRRADDTHCWQHYVLLLRFSCINHTSAARRAGTQMWPHRLAGHLSPPPASASALPARRGLATARRTPSCAVDHRERGRERFNAKEGGCEVQGSSNGASRKGRTSAVAVDRDVWLPRTLQCERAEASFDDLATRGVQGHSRPASCSTAAVRGTQPRPQQLRWSAPGGDRQVPRLAWVPTLWNEMVRNG